jgi:hypothetical protein
MISRTSNRSSNTATHMPATPPTRKNRLTATESWEMANPVFAASTFMYTDRL